MGVVINLDRWLCRNNEYILPLARFHFALQRTADVWKKMCLTLITPFAVIALLLYALLGKLICSDLPQGTKQQQLAYMITHIIKSYLPMHKNGEVEIIIRSSTQEETVSALGWKEALQKVLDQEENRVVVQISSQDGSRRNDNVGICCFFDALSDEERGALRHDTVERMLEV